MGKDVIKILEGLKLFKRLERLEEDGDHILSSLVVRVVGEVAPLLERVPENMPEYTLHDPNHGAKVGENMGKIMPEEVLQNLNSLEITLLILSAYLHDIGMTCSKSEKEEIIKHSEEYRTLFRSDINKFKAFTKYKESGDHRAATFIEDQVFTEYLRQNHVARTADYIDKYLSNGRLELSINNIPFWELLIAICDAHGEPVDSLKNLEIWPRHTLIGENIINVQYMGLVLRLADILDLDAERTPKLIYEFVNPQDPVSIVEWKKHRSIIGHSINSRTILFEAKCSSPEVERALKEFMSWIEEERKLTMALLKTYSDEISRKYYLELKEEIPTDRIKSDNSYVSSDLKFEIDYQRVIDLLTGERLYKSPIVALRELLQNAVDAIKIRLKMYENRGERFDPIIRITLLQDELILEDNGVGMDENIFANYFLQVGKSYYSSREFYGRYADVDVTGEFGIGILSGFMVANSLVVDSRREAYDPLEVHKPIRFEIPTAYGYLIQRRADRKEIGTKVRLKLKERSLLKEIGLLKMIEAITPAPAFPLLLSDKDGELIYNGVEFEEVRLVPFPGTPEFTQFARNAVSSKKSVPDETFGIFRINLSRPGHPLLKDIEGSVTVVNSHRDDLAEISQRNFRIGSLEWNDESFDKSVTTNLEGLMPNWLVVHGRLNFTRGACLSVRPDRSDVIVDHKFNELKAAISNAIVESFEEHMQGVEAACNENTLLLYRLLLCKLGFFNLRVDGTRDVPKNELLFLSKNLLFTAITPDGKFNYLTTTDLTGFKNIGYIWGNIDDGCLSKIQQFCQKENFALIVPDPKLPYLYFIRFGFFDGLFNCYEQDFLDHYPIVMDALPDFFFRLLRYEKKVAKDNVLFLKDEELDIFLFFERMDSLNININESHRVFACVEVAPDKEAIWRDLIRTVKDSIELLLSQAAVKVQEKDYAFKTVGLGSLTRQWVNVNKLMRGVFTRNNELLDMINNELTRFFEKATKEGLVESPNFIRLTERDFPPFWNN